jgi:hypothetical protein
LVGSKITGFGNTAAVGVFDIVSIGAVGMSKFFCKIARCYFQKMYWHVALSPRKPGLAPTEAKIKRKPSNSNLK